MVLLLSPLPVMCVYFLYNNDTTIKFYEGSIKDCERETKAHKVRKKSEDKNHNGLKATHNGSEVTNVRSDMLEHVCVTAGVYWEVKQCEGTEIKMDATSPLPATVQK